MSCPSGHAITPRPVRRAASRAVHERLARAHGRWLRGEVCAACREPLTLPVRRTGQTITVVAEVTPVHTIHLDLPMVRCGSCGHDQVPSRSHADVAAVVTALYEPDAR
ncbi:MAG: hypothetical protein WD638_13740 [Nitriliruptoraceae bacterium]